MNENGARKTWQRAKVIGGYILGLAASVYIYYTAWGNTLLVLLTLFGNITGWIAGILFSPKDRQQSAAFANYRAGIATFLGGFVVAKVESFLEPQVAPDKMTEAFAIGILLFSISFGLGVLFTFIGRLSDEAFTQ
jgi:hypothetical protein